MELSHYEDFKRALATGKRSAARDHIRAFVTSFGSLEEKAAWTRWFLENENYGHKIRHELYEGIIFPTLLDGYLVSDPWCLKWLIRTVQSVYASRQLWEQLGYKTEHALLRERLELCPDDDEARLDLLSNLMASLRYQIHEWPAGILYGRDGASASECLEILSDLELAQSLDRSQSHCEFLADFAAKMQQYQERLARRES